MKKKRNEPVTSQRGASLLEAILAIGVLGIVVGAASTYFAQSGTALKVENVKEMQAAVIGRIQNALINPEAMSRTLDMATPGKGLLQLKACVLGGSECVATQSASNWDFDLMDANIDADTGQPDKLTGAGVGFDTDGNRCSPGSSPKCIFSTRTRFWATCGLDTTAKHTPYDKCTVAQYVNFKFQVQVADANQVFKKKGHTIADFPPDSVYNSGDPMSALRMRVGDIVARRGGSCERADKTIDPDKKMVGIDKNGKPICRCLDGTDVDVCKPMKCEPAKKGDVMLMVGFIEQDLGAKGKILKADCISDETCENDVTNVKCPCKTVDLATDGDCGDGYWMVSIQYGECNATSSKDKGGPETVQCSKKTGRCCKLDVQ